MMRRWWLLLIFLLLWIPAVFAQDDNTQYIHYTTVRGDTATTLAVSYNICPEEILQANPQTDSPTAWFPVDTILHIPVNAEACFERFRIEKDARILDALQENNVCINDYIPYNDDYPIHYPVIEERTIHIRLDVPPCYENGQRRIFFHEGDLLPEPIMIAAQRHTANENTFLWEIVWENNLCWIDVAPANHPLVYGQQLQVGDIYYVPDDARNCDVIFPEGVSLVDLSFEYNVCIETLKEFNPYIISTWTFITQEDDVEQLGMTVVKREFNIPQNQAPCYNADGLRVGFDDKAVHRTQPDEWLYLIAQQYDVCVNDLQDANPLFLTPPRYHAYRLPAVIFIPDVPSCTERMGETLIHTMRESETYEEIFFQYNICPNRFIAANPDLVESIDDTFNTDNRNLSPSTYIEDYYTQQYYLLREPQVGDRVTIVLDRPPCYEVRATGSNPPLMTNHRSQRYICYAQVIDFGADYSNHDPVISPVPYSSDEAIDCHIFGNYGRIIINNETIWYARFGIATAAMVVDCLGIHPEAVNPTRWNVREDYIPAYGGYWTASNPPHTCPLLTGTAQESYDWRVEFRERMMEEAGHINEDNIYIVAPHDTLSTIGRKYGYLPSMLASANNLQNPDMLLTYQAVKLPAYPSLYTLAKVAAGLLFIIVFIGLIQLRMRRRGAHKEKKKNKEA